MSTLIFTCALKLARYTEDGAKIKQYNKEECGSTKKRKVKEDEPASSTEQIHTE